ncbi:MAG: hypothetical protein ACQEQC_02985 [Elusimicrobiota bacterium]
MFKLKNLLVVGLFAGLIAMPAQAQDELPVEVDIDLLSRQMTVEEAGEELARDMNAETLQTKDRKRAKKVLKELAQKGVPVNKAYEAVSKAVKEGEEVEGLAKDENVAGLKKEAAKEEVKEDAEDKSLSAEDVASSVEVLDRLVEEGVPVEQARSVVREAIKGDKNPQKLQQKITERHVNQLKEQAEKGEPDTENIGEKKRQRNMNRISNEFLKRLEDEKDNYEDDYNTPGR